MKDPNHAYNPLGKVWQEAQQRARQFRNNEKALALAFDESPLEKLFEFVQKADETPEFNIDRFKEALEGKGRSTGLFGYDEDSPSNVKNKVQSFVNKWEAHSDLIEQAFGIQISELKEFLSEYANGNNEDKREASDSMVSQIMNLSSDMDEIDEQYQEHIGKAEEEEENDTDNTEETSNTENEEETSSESQWDIEALLANEDAYKAFKDKVVDFNYAKSNWYDENPNNESGYKKATKKFGIEHDFGGERGKQSYTLDSVSGYMNKAAGHFIKLLSILEEAAQDENFDIDAALNSSPETRDFLLSAIQENGRITPIITEGLDKFLNNEYIQNILPQDEDTEKVLGTGMIEDDDQGTTTEESTGDEGVIGTGDYHPPFTLQTLNDLIAEHKTGNQNINIPISNAGWENNIKLTATQFRTLQGLGIVSGDSFKDYNWTAEGESVRRILTHGNRTQAPRGREAQPLNDAVFDALTHAITNNYLVGHIPESTIEEERNQQTTSGGASVNTEDGEGQQTTGERESVTSENMDMMSPEGWEDYMKEYPHKELDTWETDDQPYEEAQTDVKSLLLPREIGSWDEDGTFTDGAYINPFLDSEGTHINDMAEDERNAHLHDMFLKLLNIFHASNNRNNPDSLSQRFGEYSRENDPYYYTIDVTSFTPEQQQAYNSYMENNGVLEKYLLKFGDLLGLNTNRIERYRLPDPDKTMPIMMGQESDLINPATSEPYTPDELDAFTDASAQGDVNAWPENLLGTTTQERRTYNKTLPENHPAYRGGIYDQGDSEFGDDIYIHPNAWEWVDALYSNGLVDLTSGYPGFHMISRDVADRESGHGLRYNDIWRGLNIIQTLLQHRTMEGVDPETNLPYQELAEDYQNRNLWKTTHPQDKQEFMERHPGAQDGSYAEAWNDYQRFLGNPTAESEAARVLPDTDLSEEEQDIAARRAAMPDFHTWVENYLNGDYADMLGALWPENALEDGVGPNGQRRMHLYKEDDATQKNHNKPILSKADRMEKWLFSADSLNSQRNLEGEQEQSETGGERVVIGANEEDQTNEQTNEDEQETTDGTEETTSEVIPPAGGVQGEFGFDTLPARDANYIWVWQADENNPLEGSWVWKEPTEADMALLETDLAHAGWEDGEKIPTPPTPPSLAERNKLIYRILDREFPEGWKDRMDDEDVQIELEQLLKYHNSNQLVSHHEKTVVADARKARDAERKEAAKPPKPEAEIKPNDKPIETDELERMIAAYKTAVENRHQQPMSTERENWLRSQAVNEPAKFRQGYGAAIELNEKYVADEAKKQRERDANDIEGYRGILPLQQMPTEDDVKTQIRRLEYWKNKHGQHMSDKTQGIWNQRWQEISQAAANIPGFDIDEFMAADKAQAEEANMEYGGEKHLKEAGKAQVKEMYGDAAYMKAVGEGASLRANRNYKPWLVVKYDSNGAGTLHDLRQKDDVTGEWGKQIDPNSLTFDEDQHYFEYTDPETRETESQPRQSAAERFWSKLDRYANFRPIDHQGALERFDNDDNKFARTKSLLGEHGVQHGWFHPESGAWINPHRYNDIREELANAGPGSGMVIPAGEHYHGSHRPDGQGEANPRYAFARRGKAKVAQMNNNNDLSYYVDSQGNISHADGEWPAVQQKDKTQPQAVNDVIHDYYSQQFYNYFTQSGNSFKDNEGNFLTGKVLRPPSAPQQPMQQMDILKEVFRGDALERRRKQQGYQESPQPGSKDLMSDELGHSGEFWGRNQEYQQRYRDVFDKTGSGILGWLSGIVNPFAIAADVKDSPSTLSGIGRGAKGIVSRVLGKNDPAYEAIRRIRRQYRIDAEAEQRTKDVMDKLQMHGNPMRYLSPGEAKARGEDLAELRRHVSKKVAFHQQEMKKLGVNDPQHQYHNDQNLEFQGVNSQLNNLNSDLDSDWQHINRLYDDYMGNQQVQDKFAPSSEEGWANRFENPQQGYQPYQTGQQPSGGLSGLIADDSSQRPPVQGLIGNESSGTQQAPLQGLIG